MSQDELDNGLGLAAFIRGADDPEGATAPSQESAAGQEKPAETKTPDDDAAAPASEKKEGQEPSPSDPETRKDGQEDKEKSAATDLKGKEPADAAGKEEQAKPSNWDSEENPYRGKLAEAEQRLNALAQQQKHTRDYASDLNKQNVQLRGHLDRLEKKIDGKWTDADEQAAAQEQAKSAASEARDAELTAEDTAAIAELRGATVASLQMAYEKLGREKVDTEIKEFDRLFQHNPLIMQRVTSSRRPIQEALKVLTEYRTAQKYQTTDFGELIDKVREEAKAELRPQLIEEVTKEIMGKLDLKNKESGGLRNLRGSGRDSATEQLNDAAKNEHKPLSELFPG